MKKALLFGINNYMGSENDLKGCINDIDDMGDILKQFGFSVKKLTDSQVTIKNFTNELTSLLANASSDDHLVVWYSGHGTQIPSNTEPDGYDEALYLYNGSFIDDKLRNILIQKPKGIPLFIGMDCCFSGDNTKDLNKKARFKPYLNGRMMDQYGNLKGRIRRRSMFKNDDMDYIVLTGCASFQTSSDACFLGRYNGAMTFYAKKTAKPGISYLDWHKSIRKHLPNKYFEQIPQLEGNPDYMKLGIFGTEKKCWFKLFNK